MLTTERLEPTTKRAASGINHGLRPNERLKDGDVTIILKYPVPREPGMWYVSLATAGSIPGRGFLKANMKTAEGLRQKKLELKKMSADKLREIKERWVGFRLGNQFSSVGHSVAMRGTGGQRTRRGKNVMRRQRHFPVHA